MERREGRILAAIVASAALLRLIGLRAWLHPDEPVIMRAIGRLLDNGLNPGFFNYPSLFLYQGALLRSGLTALGGDPDNSVFLSRGLVAIYSIGGVLLIWALGRRLAGPATGLGAAALMAVCGPLVLWSHYALTDIPMVVLSTGCALLAVRGYQRGADLQLLLAAAIGGLAVSTKYNAAPVLAVPFVLMLVLARRGRPRRRLALAAAMPLVAVAAFVVGTPFALLDSESFADELREEVQLQAEGRPGFHFPQAEQRRWRDRGLVNNARVLIDDSGPPLLLLALLGAVTALGGWRRPAAVPRDRLDRTAIAALSIWPLLYYLLMATSVLSSRNYVLSIYPPLLLAAAWGAVVLGAEARARWGVEPGRATVAALLIAAAIPAFLSVRSLAALTSTDARLELTRWASGALGAEDKVLYELFTGAGELGAAEAHYVPALAAEPLRSYCNRGYEVLVVGSINRALYTGRTDAAYDRYRRWYRQLERRAELLAEFPGYELEFVDPTIGVYRLRCEELAR